MARHIDKYTSIEQYDRENPAPESYLGELRCDQISRWGMHYWERCAVIENINGDPMGQVDRFLGIAAAHKETFETKRVLNLTHIESIRDDELDHHRIQQTAHSRRHLHPNYLNDEPI